MGFRQAIIGVSRARDWNYRTGPVATHRDRPPGKRLSVGGPDDTAERAGGG